MEFSRDCGLMIDKFTFFGLEYSNVDMDETVEIMEGYIRDGGPHTIMSTAVELIVKSCRDESLKGTYANTDILTVDGTVGMWAARLLGHRVKSPVGTAKLMLRFLDVTQGKGYRCYFLGAKPEILENAVANARRQYPGCVIAGWHHGYFKDDAVVLEDVNRKKPDVVFVAMSSPMKERIIAQNGFAYHVPVVVGVGGGVDVLAGHTVLAPQWISAMGMEWFFRLVQEPRRLWKRYLVTNSLFVMLMIRELFLRLFRQKNQGL
ncbi:MAG: WecB/TagA/CpsF family glycosyltransferase [Nitrospirae bacterium]|nr:WecB/TagA/CpsF family glycosyltransferase [Magnetococcales bacterium]HAT50854.1 glycosyltransferase [Alphaproteobacteria bacterium]